MRASRSILALVLVVCFFVVPVGCQKTDMCVWAQNFWTGAQLGLPLFGQYAPVAQGVITTGQAITVMLCEETDAGRQAALAKLLVATIQELNQLGAKANIK